MTLSRPARTALVCLALGCAAPVLAASPVKPAPPAPQAAEAPLKVEATPLERVEREIATLETQRTQLLTRYTPLHPEIRVLNRQLESLHAERKRLAE